MSHPLLWAETFTGTASMTLQLLGGAAPPIGFMGSKRRWCPVACASGVCAMTTPSSQRWRERRSRWRFDGAVRSEPRSVT